MDRHLCANCGNELPLTGTFCLACDTPVARQEGALSVATVDPATTRPASPVRMMALVGGVAVLVGLLGWMLVRSVEGNPKGAETTAARSAFTDLVRAEAGRPHECAKLAGLLTGDRATERHACLAVGLTDRGARIRHLVVDDARVSGSTGHVHLHAVVQDGSGQRVVDRVLTLHDDGGKWTLDWNGERV